MAKQRNSKPKPSDLAGIPDTAPTAKFLELIRDYRTRELSDSIRLRSPAFGAFLRGAPPRIRHDYKLVHTAPEIQHYARPALGPSAPDPRGYELVDDSPGSVEPDGSDPFGIAIFDNHTTCGICSAANAARHTLQIYDFDTGTTLLYTRIYCSTCGSDTECITANLSASVSFYAPDAGSADPR